MATKKKTPTKKKPKTRKKVVPDKPQPVLSKAADDSLLNALREDVPGRGSPETDTARVGDLRLDPTGDASAAATAAAGMDNGKKPAKSSTSDVPPTSAAAVESEFFSAKGLREVLTVLNARWQAERSVWAMDPLELNVIVDSCGPVVDKYLSAASPYALELAAATALAMYALPRVKASVQKRRESQRGPDPRKPDPAPEPDPAPADRPASEDPRLKEWRNGQRKK